MVVQGMPVMSRASLLKMTMPAVLAAAASPMMMPGTDSVPSRADAFSKSRPPTTMANPTTTGSRRRSLNRRGDSAMVMTGAVAARTAPRPTPKQAVGSENGHHGKAQAGAGEGHEQVLATADVPG